MKSKVKININIQIDTNVHQASVDPCRIVRVTQVTAKELRAFRHKSSRESAYVNSMTLRRARDWVAATSAEYFLYMVDRSIAGQLVLDLSMPGVLHIDLISVLEEYKGTGVSSDLMKFAEHRAHATQCSRIELNVSKKNLVARAFYSKHGFSVVRTYKNFEHTHVLVLQKEVA